MWQFQLFANNKFHHFSPALPLQLNMPHLFYAELKRQKEIRRLLQYVNWFCKPYFKSGWFTGNMILALPRQTLYILVDTTGDALIMSCRAQMDACGVLCHLERHLFLPAINRANRWCIEHPVWPQWAKPICHAFFFVGMRPRCPVDVLRAAALSAVPVYRLNDEVEQVPVSQSITYSCFGQGPVDADGLM